MSLVKLALGMEIFREEAVFHLNKIADNRENISEIREKAIALVHDWNHKEAVVFLRSLGYKINEP